MVEFAAAIERLTERADKASSLALVESGRLVADSVAKQFGIGNAPHNRSDRLNHSTKLGDIRRHGFGEYEAEVGPAGLAYIRITELGKRGKRHRRSHPFFTPGFEAAHSQFAAVYKRAWEAAGV